MIELLKQKPETCPVCSNFSTFRFCAMWQCRDCYTVWDKTFVSKGDEFDKESPSMCIDFDEFAESK